MHEEACGLGALTSCIRAGQSVSRLWRKHREGVAWDRVAQHDDPWWNREAISEVRHQRRYDRICGRK